MRNDGFLNRRWLSQPLALSEGQQIESLLKSKHSQIFIISFFDLTNFFF